MTRESSDKEEHQSATKDVWRWWSSLCTRLPDWLFAPEPEPLPRPPTLGEFKDLALDVDPNSPVIKEDWARELQRIKELSERRKTFHDETSKTIRRVFYSLVGTCLFCVVTLTGKSDVQLLTPESTVKLPLLNYDMGFAAFLVVGPVVLIALTIYLHIFMGQHRRFEIAPDVRQPMLPNFGDWTPRLAVLIIFYWMVPVTLAIFTWKAWARPFGPFLLVITLVVAAASVLLQMRRCPRSWQVRALPFLVIVYVVFLFGTIGITTTRQLDLLKADLSGKDLRLTNLSRAFLVEANLSEADLTGADLGWANLRWANLDKANLSRAVMVAADLRKAKLTGAVMILANLNVADLTGANLFEADLNSVTLVGADLTDSNLTNVELSNATLTGTVLRGAILQNAKLRNANLRDAELQEADLTGADLSGADLTGADLTGATFRPTELAPACSDGGTRLPNGLSIRLCKHRKKRF